MESEIICTEVKHLSLSFMNLNTVAPKKHAFVLYPVVYNYRRAAANNTFLWPVTQVANRRNEQSLSFTREKRSTYGKKTQ